MFNQKMEVGIILDKDQIMHVGVCVCCVCCIEQAHFKILLSLRFPSGLTFFLVLFNNDKLKCVKTRLYCFHVMVHKTQ